MTERFIRTVTLVLASAATLSTAAAQAPAFSAGTPAATPDSTAKPASKPDSMPPKPEFKPSYNFNAWLFGAYSYKYDSATKAVNDDKATTKFSVDRAYLTFTGKVAPDFGFRVTTDVVTLGAGAGYSGIVIRLKYAYMQWDYLHAAQPMDMSAWARIGQIHTVVIDDEERYWARWIQKTGLEYWGIQPGSADQGASTMLNLPSKWGQAYFTIGNGGGYTVATDADRYKDVALRLSLTPMGKSSGIWKTAEITGWYQVGRSQNTFNTGINAYKAGLENNAGGVFIGNGDPRLTFGFDYAERFTQTVRTTDSVTVDNTAKLIDGFVIVRPMLFSDPKGVPWGVIVRYDNYKPNTSVDPNRTLLIAGVFIDVANKSSFGITYQDDVAHSPTNAATSLTMVQLNWQLTF